MKYKMCIWFCLILVVWACENPNKKVDLLEKKENLNLEIETEVSLKDSILPKINYAEAAGFFIQEILQENLRQHEYELNTDKRPKHLDIFAKNGLTNIIAYSDKRYPKRSKPNYYEQFILFILNYDGEKSANRAFQKLRVDTQFEYENLDQLSEVEQQRIRFLYAQTKPEGMICQKGSHIFSLVETCRNTPIGGSWEDYENKFLKYLTEPNEEIEVLNANCGKMRYFLEKRILH